MPAYTFNRRHLLAGVGGGALLAGTGGLAGCSSSSSASRNTATANDAVQLPTYVRYQGIKPDLPGTDAGVDPAFRYFPTTNPSVVSEKPGTGQTISGMANIYYAVPPGPDRNTYWQGLNDRLGVNLQLQMVSNADYTTKFATTIAGGDLPDLMQTPNGSPPPVADLPALLDKRFTNLSEFLAGDAVKDYPNLANLPTQSWKSTVFNGGIYGIPIPRGLIGSYNFIRQDLFEAKNLSTAPKGYDELLSTAKELTDPKQRRWAFGLMTSLRQFFARLNGEPNTWSYADGKLTHAYETEQYKQTVADMKAFWDAGVLHPDAFNPALPFKQLFNAGTVAINAHDGYPGWTQYILDNASNPKFKLGLMPVYDRSGDALAHWLLGSGLYSFTMLKKQDDQDRTKLLLRTLNWLAAPFGTKEYLYRLYGKEGVDHTVDGRNNPTLTKTGTTNTVLPIRYLADSPFTIYQPGRPQDANTQHAYQALEIPTGIQNPTVGLFSNAAATDNATADKKFTDAVNEIIQGRQPMSQLDSLISTWRKAAGDEMRKEYLPQLDGSAATPK